MKAELSAKARQRMSVTAARPRWGANCRSPEGHTILGRCLRVLERPVLSEIVPAVVLQLPTVMPELANLQAGEDLTISRGDPKPLLFRGFRYALAAPVVILGERFLRPDDPHRLRMVWGKGRPVGVPQAYRILFPFLANGAPLIGRPDG